MNYQRQAFRPDIDKQIITLVKESCGIRSISRILNISPTTVISRTLKISADLKRPYPIVNGNLISDSKNGVLQTDIGRSSYPYQLKGIHPAKSESIQYTYLYDTDDSRIFKRVEEGSALQMEYYLKDIGVYDMTSDKWTYFVQGDDRIAKVFPQNYQSPGQNAANTDLKVSQGMANFYEYDHLGNTRIVYSVRDIHNGTTSFDIHFAADYYPYGKTLRYFETAAFEEKFLTTQHERDRETGFDYRGARYYDADLGRFFAVDPLTAQYPHNSPYAFSENIVINSVELEGLEKSAVYDKAKEYLGTLYEWGGKNPDKSYIGISNDPKLKDQADMTQRMLNPLSIIANKNSVSNARFEDRVFGYKKDDFYISWTEVRDIAYHFLEHDAKNGDIGIDCSGLISAAYSVDKELVFDFKPGGTTHLVNYLSEQAEQGSVVKHNNYNLISKSDIILKRGHVRMATGEVRKDEDGIVTDVRVVESLSTKGVVHKWYSVESLNKGGYEVYSPKRTSDINPFGVLNKSDNFYLLINKDQTEEK